MSLYHIQSRSNTYISISPLDSIGLSSQKKVIPNFMDHTVRKPTIEVLMTFLGVIQQVLEPPHVESPILDPTRSDLNPSLRVRLSKVTTPNQPLRQLVPRSSTLMFDYPTVPDLVDYIYQQAAWRHEVIQRSIVFKAVFWQVNQQELNFIYPLVN